MHKLVNPPNNTARIQKSHSKHMHLQSSGLLKWDEPTTLPRNQFLEKIQHFSKEPTSAKAQTPISLKAEAFLKKFPIVDSPETMFEVANEIENRSRIPMSSIYESVRERSFASVQAKYKFDKGDRKKAIELQKWLNIQMISIENKERNLPELMELKQQVVQIMLNESINWVQTICTEWADCLRTGLTTICELISKTFSLISKKHAQNSKQTLEDSIETHTLYTNLIEKLKSEVSDAKKEKQLTDSFSSNLIYNMRIKTKQCRHMERNWKIMSNKYQNLKYQMRRFGLDIIEQNGSKFELPDQYDLIRNVPQNTRQKKNALHNIPSKRNLNQKLFEANIYRQSSHANILQSSGHMIILQDVSSPQIHITEFKETLKQQKQKDNNETHQYPNKQVTFNLPPKDDQKEQKKNNNQINSTQKAYKRQVCYLQLPEVKEKGMYNSRLTSSIPNIYLDQRRVSGFDFEIEAAYAQNQSNKSKIDFNDGTVQESQIGIKSQVINCAQTVKTGRRAGKNKIQTPQMTIQTIASNSSGLNKLKKQYLERRTLTGDNQFPIELSVDSINHDQLNETFGKILVRPQGQSQYIMSKQVQTEITVPDDLNNPYGTKLNIRNVKSENGKRRNCTWMNASTQTRTLCVYNSGIVSVKVSTTNVNVPITGMRRSISVPRVIVRHSVLETIRQSNNNIRRGRSFTSSESNQSRKSSDVSESRQKAIIENGHQSSSKKRILSRQSENSNSIRLSRSNKNFELQSKKQINIRRALSRQSTIKLAEIKGAKQKETHPSRTIVHRNNKSLQQTVHQSPQKMQEQVDASCQDVEKKKHSKKNVSNNIEMSSRELQTKKSGRRNANYNVLKPKSGQKSSSIDVKPVVSITIKQVSTKKTPRSAKDSADAIDAAINICLHSQRSSGKDKLVPSELLTKAKETAKLFTLGITNTDLSGSHQTQKNISLYPDNLVKQIRSMYLHGYRELVRGQTKLLLTNIIVNYFGIIYGNLKNASVREKINRFFKKVADNQLLNVIFQTFCLLSGVGSYQQYQNLICVNDLPLYLKLLFSLNCASQDNPYTTLAKINLHMHRIIEEFVGTAMANDLVTEIRSMIKSKLAYNSSTKHQTTTHSNEQNVKINLQMSCLYVVKKVFQARKSFQQDFQRVFHVLDESNTTPTVSVEFFEFLNRCIDDSKIRYISRMRTFLYECETLYQNRKCMSKEKFTMFALKTNFPRFSEISQKLNTNMRRRKTLRHIRDFIKSANCIQEWQKEKNYLWEELTRSDKLTSTEGILMEFITNMIQKANAEQAEFLQVLYEMIYYEVFDSQAQKLLIFTIGDGLTDLFVQSIVDVVHKPEINATAPQVKEVNS